MLVQQDKTLTGFSNNEVAFLESLHSLSNSMNREFVERVKQLKKVYSIPQEIWCGISISLNKDNNEARKISVAREFSNFQEQDPISRFLADFRADGWKVRSNAD